MLSEVDVLTGVKAKLLALYWTPRIRTVTVGSATEGHTFAIKIGTAMVLVTAGAGETTSTIAAKLLTAIQDAGDMAWRRIRLGGATRSDNVLTLTGYGLDFTLTTAGTGTLTLASTQDPEDAIFRFSAVVPASQVRDIARSVKNYPGALVSDGGNQTEDVQGGLPFAGETTVFVTAVHTAPLDEFRENDLIATRGLMQICDRIRAAFWYGREADGTEFWFNSDGAEVALDSEDGNTAIVRQMRFTVRHVMV
jgi:hypothetical protein